MIASWVLDWVRTLLLGAKENLLAVLRRADRKVSGVLVKYCGLSSIFLEEGLIRVSYAVEESVNSDIGG
jgi:hypothetical protein